MWKERSGFLQGVLEVRKPELAQDRFGSGFYPFPLSCGISLPCFSLNKCLLNYFYLLLFLNSEQKSNPSWDSLCSFVPEELLHWEIFTWVSVLRASIKLCFCVTFREKKKRTPVSWHMELNVPTSIRATWIYFIVVLLFPSLFIMKGKWNSNIRYSISLFNFTWEFWNFII